jgi:pyruvate/2-oxoacid:ferredoxin oxidoreductase alpha subunit
LLEKYKCEGAETFFFQWVQLVLKAKLQLIILQKQGLQIGLASVRTFRPFPAEEIIKLAKKADLIVIDRNISVGYEGALFTEVKVHYMVNQMQKFMVLLQVWRKRCYIW